MPSTCQITSAAAVTTKRPLDVSSVNRLKHVRRAGVPVSVEQFALGVNEYQTFCRLRGLSLDPAPETVREFAKYVGQGQGVDAIEGNLNAICLAFEHVYPTIWHECQSAAVEGVIREMREKCR